MNIYKKKYIICPVFFLTIYEKRKVFINISYIGKNFNGKKIINRLHYPFLIKPIYLGSSIVINKIENLNDFIKNKQNYRKNFFLEKFIKAKEISVCGLKNHILPIVKINYKSSFYDYKSKYLSKTTNILYLANLSSLKGYYLVKLSNKIFKLLNISTYARIDFIKYRNRIFWFL